MKYSVVTFGCRVNQADSLGFEEDLRAAGAVAVSPEAADLVVVMLAGPLEGKLKSSVRFRRGQRVASGTAMIALGVYVAAADAR